MTKHITTYLDQVEAIADANGFTLLEAYQFSGVADSTYYRNINGSTELSLTTAEKIAKTVLNKEAYS